MTFDNGHWQFGGKRMQPYDRMGFVYCIRHRASGIMYLGRKNYLLQGRDAGFESDWRNYSSSSKKLKSWIEREGEAAFYFIVLEEYKTPGGLGYAETWSMMHARTPENPHRFLNKSVEAVSWHSREPITARHIERLNKLLEVK